MLEDPLAPTDIHVPARHDDQVAAWLYDAGVDTPAVVLIHGSTNASRDDLSEIATMFADDATTVLVASKHPQSHSMLSRSYDLLAEDITAQANWLRERGHKRIVLVGWSEGSWIAARVAARTDLIAACVFLSPPVVDVSTQYAHEATITWPWFIPGRAITQRILSRVLARSQGFRGSFTDDFAALEMPLLAVWADNDPVVDVPRAQKLLKHIQPQAKQFLVDSWNHDLSGNNTWTAAARSIVHGENLEETDDIVLIGE
ncbi:MAG: alpha/beta hydrolase [Propionibacteriaceae bacterium]